MHRIRADEGVRVTHEAVEVTHEGVGTLYATKVCETDDRTFADSRPTEHAHKTGLKCYK